MNNSFRDNLLEARLNLTKDLEKTQSKIDAINLLLADGNKIPLRIHMARNSERRRGGVLQVSHAVSELGKGTIKQIARKVQELYPVEDEINLLSKVSTYLKRLRTDGDITVDDTVKPKVYASLGEIPN